MRSQRGSRWFSQNNQIDNAHLFLTNKLSWIRARTWAKSWVDTGRVASCLLVLWCWMHSGDEHEEANLQYWKSTQQLLNRFFHTFTLSLTLTLKRTLTHDNFPLIDALLIQIFEICFYLRKIRHIQQNALNAIVNRKLVH